MKIRVAVGLSGGVDSAVSAYLLKKQGFDPSSTLTSSRGLRPRSRRARLRGKCIALGLSGGVDSAVSAYLLKSYGYDVHCVYLNCFDHAQRGYNPAQRGDSRTSDCRGDQDRKDALAVAMHLGLPFQVLDFRKEYQAAVIDYFKKEYLLGRTPNPDVICNRDIKFGLFLDWAVKHHFEYVATGHYAKLVHRDPNNPNRHPNYPNSEHSDEFARPPRYAKHCGQVDWDRVVLLQPKDLHKDQTYFLWAVPRQNFSRVLFPLANYLKSEVRQIAKDAGLGVADKKDSTGICFVGEVRVEDFLKSLGVKEKEGEVVIQPQKVGPFVAIGSHRGVWFYTIGQRHGFEITNWPPVSLSLRGASRRATWQSSEAIRDKPVFYVIEKDIKKNRLIVGFGAETYRDSFEVSECNWLVSLKEINSKLETRNSKQIQNSNDQNSKQNGFENSNLEHSKIVSDFGFRISDLPRVYVRIRHGRELIPCSVIGSQSSVFGSKSAGFPPAGAWSASDWRAGQSAGLKPTNRKQVNQNPTTDNRKLITISLSIPQRGIAPGQSAVFYDRNGLVLGGGVIQ